MTPTEQQALRLFKQNTYYVGVVWEHTIETYTLYTETRDERVIGAALAEHGNDVTLLHALAVDEQHRHDGVGTTLVTRLEHDTDNSLIEAKVAHDNPANTFYETLDWVLERTTNDDTMNVWQKHLTAPQIEKRTHNKH